MPDFLDRLGAELHRVASESPVEMEAVAPTGNGVFHRRRGLRRRWRLAAAITLTIGTISGVAIAGDVLLTPGSVPPDPGLGVATNPDAEDVASFAILRRQQEPTDKIPDEVLAAFSGASGANRALARRVQVGEAEAWIVPGRGSMCLLFQWPRVGAGGAGCVPDSAAIHGELVLTAGGATTGQHEFVAGLVPDGVSSVTVRGGAALSRLAVRENVYLYEADGSVASVTYVGPHGVVTIAGLGLPLKR